MEKKNAKPPRGIRNNNPLNIRVGNNWVGERQHQTDGVFEQFESMEYGVRAAFIILRNYINKYKLNTVRKIVNRWAPKSENNVDKYIAVVCQFSGLKPDIPLKFNKRTAVALFKAMCIMECGQVIEDEIIEKGFSLI